MIMQIQEGTIYNFDLCLNCEGLKKFNYKAIEKLPFPSINL